MSAYSSIVINGVAVPTPGLKGVTLSYNKVWSSGTGRDATGAMTGTIVGIKRKLVLKWPVLSPSEASLVSKAVNTKTEFFTVSWTTENGTVDSGTFYAGDFSCTQYSWVHGMRYLIDVTVDLIER